MKKGETTGTVVTGFANGSVLESTDGYSMVSPDGKYAIIEHRQKVNGSTMSVQTKYSVEEVATGKVILETPLFTDVRAVRFDNNSALHIVVREQQNIVWYKNNTQIMKTGIPAGQSAQDTEAWIKRTIFFDKQNLAMAWTLDGKPKIMLNGSVITPEWKYPDDPIVGIRILKSIADNKIFYVAGGRKNMAFFVNEKVTIGNLLNDNSLYLYPLLVGDANRLDYVADISSDGTGLAIVDTNGVINSNIQQPVVRVLGKGSEVSRKVYPKGSRILDIKFSPDGNQFYYDAETDANDVSKRKVYAVVNEVEQGPWKSVENFQWSGNGSYAYTATDEKFNTVVIKNGKTVRTIRPSEYHEDVFELSQLGFSINPVDGKVFYILDNNKFVQSKVVYDEKEGIAYTGSITGVNWGKSFFSNDGKHLVYLITPPDTQNSGSIRLVIDEQVQTVEGTLLGSWSSNEGGYSDDGKWFGMYVMKENAVWWIPYNLEEMARQQ